MLSHAIAIAKIQAAIIFAFGNFKLYAFCSELSTSRFGRILLKKLSSKQAITGTMVTQLRNERLPLNIKINWNEIIKMPAAYRKILGEKMKNGTINSIK